MPRPSQYAALLATVKNRRQLKTKAEELIKTEDAYNCILRGHTLLHGAMNDAFRVRATDRSAFDDTQLGFPTLVHLLVAFDVLKHKSSVPFLQKLNTIRNRLAHQPEYEPEIETLHDLLPNDLILPAPGPNDRGFYQVKWFIVFLVTIIQALEKQEQTIILQKRKRQRKRKGGE